MRRPSARGCAGALAAVALVAIAMSVPATLGEHAVLPRIETYIASACGGDAAPCPPPERVALLRRLDRILARRMPAVEETERRRIADAIVEEAREAALDPLFVLALIAVESGFDHVAESERGARGLMQLRPSTLEREALRSRLDADDLDDPVLNVRAGIRYYRRLLRAFGSPDVALMAYNAGPNRILRYLKEDEEIPERFLAYPKKVNRELRRLQRSAQHGAAATATADARPALTAPGAGRTAAD